MSGGPLERAAFCFKCQLDSAMNEKLNFTFTEDEAEILVDALDADIEGYEDSIKDARANGNRSDVVTFSEAAERIKAVRDKIKAKLGDED